MKVIFLDFDGVLYGIHNIYDKGKEVDHQNWINKIKETSRILGDICKENGAKVVIASSYKDCIDEETLKTDVEWINEILNIFKENEVEVIGRTPHLRDIRGDEYDGNPKIWKEDEILAYIDKHPEIDYYCVIDDDDLVKIPAREQGDFSRSDLNKVRDHLVTTTYISFEEPYEEGLQESHKEEVGKILEKKIDREKIRRLK